MALTKRVSVVVLGMFCASAAQGERADESKVVFDAVDATAEVASTYAPRTIVDASESLDLSIGDLSRVLTPAQLNEALGIGGSRLSNMVTPTEETLEQVDVRATREQHDLMEAPIPFGFASIAWAVRNPTQAWRMFFPVELEERFDRSTLELAARLDGI